MREDEVLMEAVTSRKDFIQSVFLDDPACDWKLAHDFGEFVIGISPEFFLGYLISTRALRHLGDTKSAHNRLERCRAAIAAQEKIGFEDGILQTLEEEARLLIGDSPEIDQ